MAIKVFDQTGKFLRAMGRRGEGPGEFTYIGDMVPLRGQARQPSGQALPANGVSQGQDDHQPHDRRQRGQPNYLEGTLSRGSINPEPLLGGQIDRHYFNGLWYFFSPSGDQSP
ncbi:MAG: hypothetical protein IMZ57_06390 [Acidobacteria bacterium]|nr:hypothetical protein [Acidobacteriota bacterium]